MYVPRRVLDSAQWERLDRAVVAIMPFVPREVLLPLHDPHLGGGHAVMHRGESLVADHWYVSVLDRLRTLPSG